MSQMSLRYYNHNNPPSKIQRPNNISQSIQKNTILLSLDQECESNISSPPSHIIMIIAAVRWLLSMLKGNSSALLYYNMYLADGIVDGFLLAPWSLWRLSTTIVCSFSGSAGQSAHTIIIINISHFSLNHHHYSHTANTSSHIFPTDLCLLLEYPPKAVITLVLYIQW